MRFVVLSDTHGHHRSLTLPVGDVLIHAGDLTARGEVEEVVDFLDWLAGLDYRYKIIIGGNHDFFLDRQPAAFQNMLPPDITYLNHEGYDIGHLRLWGAPASPDLPGWAFGKSRDAMQDYWKQLPANIDILITHTPPSGILDRSSSGHSLGCTALLQKIREIVPRYHLFGHIHASYGTLRTGETTFINASILDSRRGPVNAPIVFEL
jgi:predicted phosphohydrolase